MWYYGIWWDFCVIYAEDINLLPGRRQEEVLKGKGGGHCQISSNWTIIFTFHHSPTCSELPDTGLMDPSTSSHDQWPPWVQPKEDRTAEDRRKVTLGTYSLDYLHGRSPQVGYVPDSKATGPVKYPLLRWSSPVLTRPPPLKLPSISL